jgi:hypothetical protein
MALTFSIVDTWDDGQQAAPTCLTRPKPPRGFPPCCNIGYSERLAKIEHPCESANIRKTI